MNVYKTRAEEFPNKQHSLAVSYTRKQKRKLFSRSSKPKSNPLFNWGTLQTSVIYIDTRNELEKWWEKEGRYFWTKTQGIHHLWFHGFKNVRHRKHGKFSGEGLLSVCPVLYSKIKHCWINPTSPTEVLNLSQYNFPLTAAQRTRMFEVWFKTRFPGVLMYIISKYTLEICVINTNSESLLTPANFLL